MLKNILFKWGKHISFFVICFSWASVSHAQTSANASGGAGTGSGGTLDYSVGKVVYTTHTGTTGSLAQGVHHPFEITLVNTIEESNITLSVFPNPTTKTLTLDVSEFKNGDLSYQLIDVNGTSLKASEIVEQQTQIDMKNLPTGTYIMNIIGQDQLKQSFKIVKN